MPRHLPNASVYNYSRRSVEFIFVPLFETKLIFVFFVWPGNGSQTLRTLFLFFLGLLLSDFQCTKAFSFHNRR